MLANVIHINESLETLKLKMYLWTRVILPTSWAECASITYFNYL